MFLGALVPICITNSLKFFASILLLVSAESSSKDFLYYHLLGWQELQENNYAESKKVHTSTNFTEKWLYIFFLVLFGVFPIAQLMISFIISAVD